VIYLTLAHEKLVPSKLVVVGKGGTPFPARLAAIVSMPTTSATQLLRVPGGSLPASPRSIANSASMRSTASIANRTVQKLSRDDASPGVKRSKIDCVLLYGWAKLQLDN